MTTPIKKRSQTTLTGEIYRSAIFVATKDTPQAITAKVASMIAIVLALLKGPLLL